MNGGTQSSVCRSALCAPDVCYSKLQLAVCFMMQVIYWPGAQSCIIITGLYMYVKTYLRGPF